ncbi:hypothetical protein [Desulfobulbus oligotrophicus]|uniref:Uncharacterized protein n=1 Tax=Desulfobulbus oligotrophicus TaxID=1909699 RepID=A0A7T6AQK8_9BACT|nr:hypothetical protein [Desulfobulbus oligotrophicus]QQG65856.1 hypothetical protein HP555_08245 [Desulfobulbus oligotrophicus]
MNNIQEMDWADDRWHGHTGMDSTSEYCRVEEGTVLPSAEEQEPAADQDTTVHSK